MKTEHKDLIGYANENATVLSLLYDLDLMPEQTHDKPEQYAMTLNVIAHCRKIRADALRHAAGLCRAGGRTEDIENAEAIEAEVAKLEASGRPQLPPPPHPPVGYL